MKLQIFISQSTDFRFSRYRFSFLKVQIFVSQSTDFHFAKYRFSFRKVQIFISQSTDFHFAKYRFHFVSFRFAKYHFAKYNKPITRIRIVYLKWQYTASLSIFFPIPFAMNKCHVQTFNDVAVCGMRRHNNVQKTFF